MEEETKKKKKKKNIKTFGVVPKKNIIIPKYPPEPEVFTHDKDS